MSSATHIPETPELHSERPGATTRRVRVRKLLPKSLARLRAADGFSYARSVGFQTVLATLPGLIFFVAVATWTGTDFLVRTMEQTLTSLVSAPTAEVFMEVIEQAEVTVVGNMIAIVAGGIAALTSGTVAMSQMIEGADRIYGITRDRPPRHRYGLALLLAVGVGALFVAAFFAIISGEILGDLVGDDSVWLWLRWPLGVGAVVLAVTALYRIAPNRNQPPYSWLVLGGGLGAVVWIVASVGLSVFLALSGTFGDVYGPLAGFMGLLLWAQLTGFALLGGLAFAAQLEAERAGIAEVSEEPTDSLLQDLWQKVK